MGLSLTLHRTGNASKPLSIASEGRVVLVSGGASTAHGGNPSSPGTGFFGGGPVCPGKPRTELRRAPVFWRRLDWSQAQMAGRDQRFFSNIELETALLLPT